MRNYRVHRIRFVEHKPKSINAIAFYNDPKHSRLALAREDGSIEIRDPHNDWALMFVIPGNDKKSVENLAWCNGRLISGSVSGHIIEWDLERLQPKYHQDSYGGPVWCLQFSRDKKQLATGCEDGGIHLFDVLKDSIIYKSCLCRQQSRILCLGWSHDDKYIFTGGFDSTIHKCDVSTGQIVSRMTTDDLKSQNTMVWSMEVLSNNMFVVGDSLGNTQFWDGNMCTLVHSFKSHGADVLAVAVDDDERSVYTTGIDSLVVEFKLIFDDDGGERWALARDLRPSKHDVRTLCMCGGPFQCLVSGGIDPRFIVYQLNEFDLGGCRWQACLPQKDVCQLAKSSNLLMFREQHAIHVWKLNSGDLSVAALEEDPLLRTKLIEIRSDRPDHLLSAAISSKGNFIAYSNINKGQLFHLNVKVDPPSLKKSDVKVPPSTHMSFLCNETMLVTVGTQRCINIVDINKSHSSAISFPDDVSVSLPFKHLSVSPCDKLVCVIDGCSKVFIFSLQERKFISSLPHIQGEVIVGATFSPKNNNLFVITLQKQIYEYNLDTGKFEMWCLELNRSQIIPTIGKKKDKERVNIVINPAFPEELFIQETDCFGKIIHSSDIPPLITENSGVEDVIRKHGQDIYKMFHKYKSIMFLDFTSMGELVVVELPWDKVLAQLPPPLKRKQFAQG